MDVESGVDWFAGEDTEFVDEILLEVVGEVGLGAEEDDTTFRD